MSPVAPTVRSTRAAAYRVPTAGPEADGTLAWDSTTIVVVRLEAGDVHGLGWTYADAACVPLINDLLAPVIKDLPVSAVPRAWQAMQQRIRNLGRPGLVSCALSAVDVALWDAASRWLEIPVADLLGRCRDQVDVYGSGGFTSYDDDQLVEQVHNWTDGQQLGRIKIKIGESWGSRQTEDVRRVSSSATRSADASNSSSTRTAATPSARPGGWRTRWPTLA
ncbi:hypothetical protein GCM10027613_40970 [Microlunatus endophyticus]